MPHAFARTGVSPLVAFVVATLVAAAATACAGRGPGQVSPREISDLQARLSREPANGALLDRYAAALLASEQCDSARVVARKALARNPADAVSALVVGQCLERAGRFDSAISGYRRFAAEHGQARGAAAVRGRELIARRSQANTAARAALRREQELAQQPGDPQTIAVLPLEVIGDSSYRPLGRGLAQMLISDLSLLQRFRMVERLQVGAIMDELKFGQGARVDPTTAARVGRLVSAGRLVQGQATIPKAGPVRLEASVVQRTGEVSGAAQLNGRLRELLQMEKGLVVQLAGRLGYQLAEAERRAILENGTKSIQAFLAYSRGLLAEDAGDFSRAALYFRDAVQADPRFQAAHDQQQTATGAAAAQSGAADVAQVVAKSNETPPASAETASQAATENSVRSGVVESAPNHVDQVAAGVQNPVQNAVNTNIGSPPPTTTNSGTTQTVTGTVSIILRLP